MTKILCAATLIAIFGVSESRAQRMITLDNEACVRGLAALASLIDAEIKPASVPRKFGSKCRAQGIRLTSVRHEVELKLDKMEWGVQGFGVLATGRMPTSLRLSVSGVRVVSAPDDQPVWSYLAGRANGAQSMDGKFAFSYLSSDNKLVLQQAAIDFQNGNTVNLTVRFSGVSPKVPSNPALGVVSYFLDEMSLSITSGAAAPNPALALLLARLRQDMPDAPLEDVKGNATEFVAKEFGAVLGADDMRDLLRLITELPRTNGRIRLGLKSAKGFALVRLALFNPDVGLAAAFDGLDITFAYGPRTN